MCETEFQDSRYCSDSSAINSSDSATLAGGSPWMSNKPHPCSHVGPSFFWIARHFPSSQSCCTGDFLDVCLFSIFAFDSFPLYTSFLANFVMACRGFSFICVLSALAVLTHENVSPQYALFYLSHSCLLLYKGHSPSWEVSFCGMLMYCA